MTFDLSHPATIAAMSAAGGIVATLAVGLLRAKRAEAGVDRHEGRLQALELRVQAAELNQNNTSRRLDELREELRQTRDEILAAIRGAA